MYKNIKCIAIFTQMQTTYMYKHLPSKIKNLFYFLSNLYTLMFIVFYFPFNPIQIFLSGSWNYSLLTNPAQDRRITIAIFACLNHETAHRQRWKDALRKSEIRCKMNCFYTLLTADPYKLSGFLLIFTVKFYM